MKNKSGRPLTGRSVQEILQDKRERAAKIAALSDNTQKDVKEGQTMTQAQQDREAAQAAEAGRA